MRTGAARSALAGAALLAAAGLATGGGAGVAAGGSGARDAVLRVVALGMVAAAAAGVPALAWLAWSLRPDRMRPRRVLAAGGRFVGVAMCVAVLVAAAGALWAIPVQRAGDDAPPEARAAAPAPPAAPAHRAVSDAWIIAAATAGTLGALGVLAVGRARVVRRRVPFRTPRPRAGPFARSRRPRRRAYADLEAEPDARRAVLAAYALLEQALAARGVPRRAEETPRELLARLGPGPERLAAARLTPVYERARYSRGRVGRLARATALAAVRPLLEGGAQDGGDAPAEAEGPVR